ncbi:MAG: alpha/beta fold hydrolase, partial [Actinomycetota bacterium]
CAAFEVPLDHDDPDGKTLELAVLRIAGEQPVEGVMMFNPGGPGIPTLPQAQVMEGFFDVVAPHHDVVLVDNRGVGQSTPVDCVELEDVADIEFAENLESVAEVEAQQRIVERVLSRCRDLVGDERLRHLGTTDVARDMDAVRDALEVEQLSFVGGSYGTVQGYVYAQLFP